MDRFLVPRLGFVVVIGLATVLIGVIVLRSPDTHGNLWEAPRPGYVRTDIAMLREGRKPENPKMRTALLSPETSWGAVASMDPGKRIYLEAGCALCHGLDARGAEVGPSLTGSSPQIVGRMVREGPGGMPSYTVDEVSDADLDKLAAYLSGLPLTEPDSAEVAALQNLAWDPAVSQKELLRGKVILRQSCAACHSQPTKEEIRSLFGSDPDLMSLVAVMAGDANLSAEDAKALARYLLALRNNADPVKSP